MVAPALDKLMTGDEFYLRPEGRQNYELVKGALKRMSPANYEQGILALRLGRLLGNFVAEHDLGDVLGAETGFTLARNPDTVRAPDVAFVSKSRRPSNRKGFVSLAPDLVVEIVSPSDEPDEVQAKIEDYLDAGVKVIWVVYPKTQSVTTYRSLGDARILRADDTLTAEDILPGFKLPVALIFA